jgi:hypothetical protein
LDGKFRNEARTDSRGWSRRQGRTGEASRVGELLVDVAAGIVHQLAVKDKRRNGN